MPQIEIVVVPLGSFPTSIADEVTASIQGLLPIEARVILSPWRITPPLEYFDWKRRQFRADRIVDLLASTVSFRRPFRLLVLGMSEADAYVEGFNFVFGIADPRRGVATVFTKRLKSANYSLYIERIVKESLHEIGHLLGLEHCPDPSCVMSFSNTIYDVDRKKAAFCDNCTKKLRLLMESRRYFSEL